MSVQKCGAVEKDKPPCQLALDEEGYCSLHCRARVRACAGCKRRYEKGETGVDACPACGRPRWCARHHHRGARRCYRHGGKSPKGLTHYKLGSGERSRYLGVLRPQTRRRFEERQHDPALLSLEPDLWMLDTRIEALVERAEGSREHGDLWRDAQAAFAEFVTANERRGRSRR